MIVKQYLTAYPAVYGQFPQAIPQQIAAVPAQREGKQLSANIEFSPFIPSIGLFYVRSYRYIYLRNKL